MRKSKKEIKNWDGITYFIIGLSVLLLIFTFLSPLIFTAPSSIERLDFSKTGQIGDTIGGILNPFIALIGVLITFLAFYMQIKANQIQISQFNEEFEKDRTEKIEDERKDCLNKLNLLKVDLGTIKNDINLKATEIKKYYEEERNNPFKTNNLLRTPSKKYTRVLEIDRLSIFKGFSYFLNKNTDWIKDFSNLYNILDFLPEFFDDIYEKHEAHSKDLFQKKMNIRDNLIQLMNELSKFINLYLSENNRETYLSYKASRLANETVARYYNIINSNFNDDNQPINETDFEEINENVLLFFITNALELKKTKAYDDRLNPIIQFCGDLRKYLFEIKQRSFEFSESVESQYNSLMIDNESNKSYYTIIDNIHEMLRSELENLTIK
ncbi:hypothetical protein [Tenacibaculum aiptasiae]|uniref:hypothetical protein n=1 Tax=Tenacibaculum aiptasiae TaxID=426481 RepID=UPI003B595B06